MATLTIAAPADAEISPNGEITWGVYGLDTDTETDTIRSQVFAIEQIGNTIYVGGKFTEARAYSSATPVAQPYLAAFNATTGDLISSFSPDLESAVYSLQASPDGTRLFVGGEFRSINGDNEARGLAALDPATGAVDTSWRSKVTNTSGARGVVHSLTIDGGNLYFAGRFDQVGGQSRPIHQTEKTARVALSNGTADSSYATDVDGGAVWGIAVAPDGSKVYLAGYHDTVDGNPAGADFSVLNATDGSLMAALSDVGGNSTNPARWYGQDVVAVGDHVFWGGSEHVVRVYRISDGALVTQHSTDRGGDFQDLEVVGDRVYASCHCYTTHFADYDYWPNRPNVPGGVAATPIKYVSAYSAATGAHLPSFGIDASAVRAGVWAIHGDTNGCLWVGGDLSRITTVAGTSRTAGGFAQFCEGNGVDGSPPTAPSNPTQTRAEDHKIVIRWDASADNLGVTNYEISRDGVVVGSKSAGASGQYWYVDAGLAEGTTYSYSIVALDAAGNRSAATTVDATTTGDGGVGALPAPTGLRSTRQTRERIVLTWDRVPGAAGYVIQRSQDGVNFTDVGTKSNNWFTNLGLDAGTTYGYRVVALDGNDVPSAPSIIVDVSTQP